MSSSPEAAALDRDALVERIASVLAPRREVLEAYLFGSQATGEATERSDLDLAILLKPDAARAAASHRFTLFAECSRALKRNDIDLVILNTAKNLILQNDIIHTGVVLYSGDTDARIDYELKTQHLALDFRFQRNMAMGV